MNILQISTFDLAGGAEKIAWMLHQAYLVRGYASWMAVGHKHSQEPTIIRLPNDAYRSRWARFWKPVAIRMAERYADSGVGATLGNLINYLAEPVRWLRVRRGHEDFACPASTRLPELLPQHPDVIHCHNLHGGYFDLRVLAQFSQQCPVVLTLHDGWLLSGHCVHSFECDRWKSGCGHCPDLTIPVAIKRDATASNWRRKQRIYANSRFYVATPSRWLLHKVKDSMLAPAIIESRVIPNGIDMGTFQPADRRRVRKRLGLAPDAKILVFAANGIRQNPWKDYQTLREAVARIAEQAASPIHFIGVGETAPQEQIGKATIEFAGYQSEPTDMANYYQAADVYIHAAKADTFPNTVLEACACGTPVVATAVGGIPEQIEVGVTGCLVPPQDPQAIAAAVQHIFDDHALRQRLRTQAAQTAKQRFSYQRMADEYLDWYSKIVR